MLKAYPNDIAPTNVPLAVSPALLVNVFYNTGLSPFFIAHERFFQTSAHDA